MSQFLHQVLKPTLSHLLSLAPKMDDASRQLQRLRQSRVVVDGGDEPEEGGAASTVGQLVDDWPASAGRLRLLLDEQSHDPHEIYLGNL